MTAAQVAEPHKKGWDPLSILLAPVAPLMAALAGARSHEGASTSVYNKHDMLLDVLSAAAAVPEAQVRDKLSSGSIWIRRLRWGCRQTARCSVCCVQSPLPQLLSD